MPADAATRRLLASEPFSRCRRIADAAVSDPHQLRVLLAEVELKIIESDFLRSQAAAVHIDIAAAVVEAFLEAGEPVESLDAAQRARLRVVVAGLQYLVMEQDVVPDRRCDGLGDDLTVLRWTNLVAAGSEGHSINELDELDP